MRREATDKPPGDERNEREFDFALSFAGEDRRFAEKIASRLQQAGARVFYDHYFKSRLLGEKLTGKTGEFDLVYGPRTHYFVPLVSSHYIRKDYPRYEFSIAKREQEKRPYRYILPLRLDRSLLVGLPDDIGYLNLRGEGLDEVIQQLLEKLESLTGIRPAKVPTSWAAVFGLNIPELTEEWELPASAPPHYAPLCDWLEVDLLARVKGGTARRPRMIEDARDGETLSVRVAFDWNPEEDSLDFGDLDWWSVVEVVPFEEA